MFTADQLLFHSSRGSFQIPQKGGLLMKTLFSTLFSFAERIAGPLLRISLGLVLLWIGSLHLQNPQSIVVLLSLSLPFLAYSAFVYVLGALEVIAGIMLIAGLWVRYVGLLTLVLFAGTHLFALDDLLELLLAQSSCPTEEAFLEGTAVVKGQDIERLVVSNFHVSSRISVSLLFLPIC